MPFNPTLFRVNKVLNECLKIRLFLSLEIQKLSIYTSEHSFDPVTLLVSTLRTICIYKV